MILRNGLRNRTVRRHALELGSRRGSGYLVLTLLMLGFCITLMSMALDGLGWRSHIAVRWVWRRLARRVGPGSWRCLRAVLWN